MLLLLGLSMNALQCVWSGHLHWIVCPTSSPQSGSTWSIRRAQGGTPWWTFARTTWAVVRLSRFPRSLELKFDSLAWKHKRGSFGWNRVGSDEALKAEGDVAAPLGWPILLGFAKFCWSCSGQCFGDACTAAASKCGGASCKHHLVWSSQDVGVRPLLGQHWTMDLKVQKLDVEPLQPSIKRWLTFFEARGQHGRYGGVLLLTPQQSKWLKWLDVHAKWCLENAMPKTLKTSKAHSLQTHLKTCCFFCPWPLGQGLLFFSILPGGESHPDVETETTLETASPGGVCGGNWLRGTISIHKQNGTIW